MCRLIMSAAHCLIPLRAEYLMDAQPEDFIDAGLNFTAFPNAYTWNKSGKLEGLQSLHTLCYNIFTSKAQNQYTSEVWRQVCIPSEQVHFLLLCNRSLLFCTLLLPGKHDRSQTEWPHKCQRMTHRCRNCNGCLHWLSQQSGRGGVGSRGDCDGKSLGHAFDPLQFPFQTSGAIKFASSEPLHLYHKGQDIWASVSQCLCLLTNTDERSQVTSGCAKASSVAFTWKIAMCLYCSGLYILTTSPVHLRRASMTWPLESSKLLWLLLSLSR